MSAAKKLIRKRFRAAVFARDGYACVGCGFASSPDRADDELDAHHITDRTEMPHAGYVPENGVSLCEVCHAKAEAHHRGDPVPPGFGPTDLYRRIGSSHAAAVRASERPAE